MTTVADVVTTVRRLADAHPDRIAGCSYMAADHPHCIIGEALSERGASNETLHALSGVVGPMLLGMAGVEVDDVRDRTKMNWLWMVQSHQDSGDDWSMAVTKADRAARVFGWSV